MGRSAIVYYIACCPVICRPFHDCFSRVSFVARHGEFIHLCGSISLPGSEDPQIIEREGAIRNTDILNPDEPGLNGFLKLYVIMACISSVIALVCNYIP